MKPTTMVDANGQDLSHSAAPIIATLNLTADDVTRAYQLHARSQLTTRRSLVSFWVMVFVLAVFVFLAVDAPLGRLVILAAAIVSGVLAPRLSIRWWLPRSSRRIYAQQRDLQRPISIALSAVGLRVENENGHSLCPWSDFVRLREDDGMLLLYRSDALF